MENTELCQFVEDIYFAGVMTQYSYDEVTAFQGFTSTPFMICEKYLFILENPFVLTVDTERQSTAILILSTTGHYRQLQGTS